MNPQAPPGGNEAAPTAVRNPTFMMRFDSLNRHFNHRLDKLTLWVRSRWCAFGVIILFFIYRIISLQGFYIIAYGYGIGLLNLLIGFLSPAVDPELDFEIPVEEGAEFRPFVRRLPEFKFWWSGFKWGVVSCILTFFSALDLPVFWPILVGYFIVLSFLTMKDRIKHMIRYRYVPWTTGKKKPKSLLPTNR